MNFLRDKGWSEDDLASVFDDWNKFRDLVREAHEAGADVAPLGYYLRASYESHINSGSSRAHAHKMVSLAMSIADEEARKMEALKDKGDDWGLQLRLQTTTITALLVMRPPALWEGGAVLLGRKERELCFNG